MSATACTENADASTPMTTDGQPESTYLRMCFVTGNVNKKKELERIMSSAGDCKIDLTSHAADSKLDDSRGISVMNGLQYRSCKEKANTLPQRNANGPIKVY